MTQTLVQIQFGRKHLTVPATDTTMRMLSD